jgi:hypothetical protein
MRATYRIYYGDTLMAGEFDVITNLLPLFPFTQLR